MMNFQVNTDKCDNCGLCSADCPVLIIHNKGEYPAIKEGKEHLCIKCQHCLAICPHGAISIWGKNPENSISVVGAAPTPKQMAHMMKSRRSVRKFKKEEIDPALIHEMITTASYAPTGENANAVQFTVADHKADLDSLREVVYEKIGIAYNAGKLPREKMYLNRFRTLWLTKGIDVIFRNAPHLLIVSSPKNGICPETDCSIALTHFDLLAVSHGFGTLWNGFATWMFEDIAPELKQPLGIPDNHVVTGALVFGKPAVKYARTVQNTPNFRRITL